MQFLGCFGIPILIAGPLQNVAGTTWGGWDPTYYQYYILFLVFTRFTACIVDKNGIIIYV